MMLLYSQPLDSIPFGQLRLMTAGMRQARDEAKMDLLALPEGDELRNDMAITFSVLVNAVAEFEEELEARAALN